MSDDECVKVRAGEVVFASEQRRQIAHASPEQLAAWLAERQAHRLNERDVAVIDRAAEQLERLSAQLADSRRVAADLANKHTRVLELIARARAISPSDRMTVMLGDLEHVVGLRDQPARTITGSNE